MDGSRDGLGGLEFRIIGEVHVVWLFVIVAIMRRVMGKFVGCGKVKNKLPLLRRLLKDYYSALTRLLDFYITKYNQFRPDVVLFESVGSEGPKDGDDILGAFDNMKEKMYARCQEMYRDGQVMLSPHEEEIQDNDRQYILALNECYHFFDLFFRGPYQKFIPLQSARTSRFYLAHTKGVVEASVSEDRDPNEWERMAFEDLIKTAKRLRRRGACCILVVVGLGHSPMFEKMFGEIGINVIRDDFPKDLNEAHDKAYSRVLRAMEAAEGSIPPDEAEELGIPANLRYLREGSR